MQVYKSIFSLVEKYNVPGPRYTSYPTALQFSEKLNPSLLEKMLAKRAVSANPISLYFHIPFCFSLCWYCGCTKIITRERDQGDIYLDYLEKEIELTQRTLHPGAHVKQIHFGGGTPTFLTPMQLRRLGGLIHNSFDIQPGAEFSVEIDPRRVDEDHISALKEIGYNRASLGVQDTNFEVQQAIHRIQPFSQTKKITQLLLNYGIHNINFDLIYGLPKQTPDTFRQTLIDVTSLNPDRFAVYSYAHIPALMPAQKLMIEADFPSTEEKLSMLVHAIEKLPDAGYQYIGMDHFAKENDELSLALGDGTLQRNFQGYSTHAELEMIALGMSGISQGSDLYYQNEKDLGRFYQLLDEGKLPVNKVLYLTRDDKIRRNIIMQIMCKARIDYNSFLGSTGCSFTDLFADEIDHLKQFEADGLLILTDTGFALTTTGRLFLRNIAHCHGI